MSCKISEPLCAQLLLARPCLRAMHLAQLFASADTARPPLGLTETLQEGQRRHSSDLERAESLVRSGSVLPLVVLNLIASTDPRVSGQHLHMRRVPLNRNNTLSIELRCRAAAATASRISQRASQLLMASTGATGWPRSWLGLK